MGAKDRAGISCFKVFLKKSGGPAYSGPVGIALPEKGDHFYVDKKAA